MSFTTHPAPRMMTAPTPKRSMYHAGVVGGAAILVDAIVIAHAPGQYSRIVPIGLSKRSRRMYGCIFFGKRSTQDGGSAETGAPAPAPAAAAATTGGSDLAEEAEVGREEAVVGTFGGWTVEFALR